LARRGQSEGYLNGIDFVDEPIYALCRSEKRSRRMWRKATANCCETRKSPSEFLTVQNRPQARLYGAIKTPQRFQIKRPVSMSELIVVSGGFTDNVSGEIQIFRLQNLNCFQVVGEKNLPTDETERSGEKFVAAHQVTGSNYINIKISDLLTGKKESNPLILDGDVVTVLKPIRFTLSARIKSETNFFTLANHAIRAINSAGGLT
jgi:protein involved in polysaccharide export with SLBB domain